jgi:hypothetical protein
VSIFEHSIFPDSSDIAHGMGMLAFFPMIGWTFPGLVYLAFIRLLWVFVRKATAGGLPENASPADAEKLRG